MPDVIVHLGSIFHPSLGLGVDQPQPLLVVLVLPILNLVPALLVGVETGLWRDGSNPVSLGSWTRVCHYLLVDLGIDLVSPPLLLIWNHKLTRLLVVVHSQSSALRLRSVVPVVWMNRASWRNGRNWVHCSLVVARAPHDLLPLVLSANWLVDVTQSCFWVILSEVV